MNWRLFLTLAVAIGLAPGTWLHGPNTPPPAGPARVTVTALALPPGCCRVGPSRITGAWDLRSADPQFGGYSALIVPRPGMLLALGDGGDALAMPQPGAAAGPVGMGPAYPRGPRRKAERDLESAVWDAHSGRIWLGFEGQNSFIRLSPGGAAEARAAPPAMRDWPINQGAEAFTRLADGRFVALSESYAHWLRRDRHQGVVFSGDPAVPGTPAASFTFAGIAGYRPTDMAQLPDGRVLILMRRLRWPMPPRFAVRLAVADPARLAGGALWPARDLGAIAAPAPLDNYEGLAVVPARDGRVTVWIISDANGAVTQRTILLRLALDPRQL